MVVMNGRLRIDDLRWDDWNRAHIAKHAVLPEEVDDVVAGEPSARETYKNRVQLVGPTSAGRMLSIVAGSVPDQPRVFGARPASRKQRGNHEQAARGANL